ncbi:hypothetical protein JFK97_04180 [Chromobacterium phragmitis]|uniref:hypothetical protein n=1 Tax=Chromobacterium amazonense TaxID=1382803 RepID=UPI0021B7BB37|nr:hypothetical protein [Chromobacterium amazonense]MBM2883578.1 hypothetical protein [Chromobacterium amazonense]MDE1715381.1 hypothetical protein [Chromobacterium amazonense]
MNRTLDPAAALHWLASRLDRPQWSLADTVVSGQLGERAARARRFDTGLTVALTLDRPPRQAAGACLLLAATPEARDDALYLSGDRLWLLRRYPVALTEVELDLLFKQQQAMAALLAARERAAPVPLPIAGRYA